MNSFIAIELNGLLSDWVKTHPITGKDNLDQRIVTLSITLITTYITVVVAQISMIFWTLIYSLFKKDSYLDAEKNDNIVHIQLDDQSFLYDKLCSFIDTLEVYEADNNNFESKKDKRKSFKITRRNDGSKPWRISEGTTKLPVDEFKESIVSMQAASLTESDKIHQIYDKERGIVSKHYVIFEKRKFMIAKFNHKERGLFLYHLFIEREEKETDLSIINFVDRLMNECYNYYKKTKEDAAIKNISLFEIVDNKWVETNNLEPKSQESIIGKTSKEIVKDVKNFESELGKLYKSLDIPYKRGYMLYGPPGTGKTSIVKAVASCTKRNIYKVTFNEKNLDDDDYKNLLSKTSLDGIILMDDIDPKLLQEGGYIEKIKSKTIKDEIITEKCRVSYPTLLDALDGINANNGRIVFITTNHPDKMGKALTRPGRIDMKRKLGYADDNEIKEYFHLFYKYFTLSEDLITTRSEIFIKNVRNVKGGKEITFAQLQQYLVQYMIDIETAAKNAETIFEHDYIEACV